jgi:hypothetical protein
MAARPHVSSVARKRVVTARRRIPRVYILIGLAIGSWALLAAVVILFLWIRG